MLTDEKDMKILDFLITDGRKPFTEIAKELKTSESSVRKRHVWDRSCAERRN